MWWRGWSDRSERRPTRLTADALLPTESLPAPSATGVARSRSVSIGHGTSATPVSRVGGENTMSSVATLSTAVST